MKKYIAFEINIPDDVREELEFFDALLRAISDKQNFFFYNNRSRICYFENIFTQKWEYIDEPK